MIAACGTVVCEVIAPPPAAPDAQLGGQATIEIHLTRTKPHTQCAFRAEDDEGYYHQVVSTDGTFGLTTKAGANVIDTNCFDCPLRVRGSDTDGISVIVPAGKQNAVLELRCRE